MMQSPSLFKKIALALLVLVLVYAGMAIALRAIGLENVHQFIQQAGVLAPVLFLVICTISLIFAPISGSSLFVLSGVLFGHEIGFLLSFLASLLGCSINFWISRKFGRKVVTRFIGQDHLTELDRFTYELKSHHSIFYMIILMPLAQDIVSYAIGLTKITYSHFLVALTVSGAAIVAVYIHFGSSLLEAII